MNHVFRRLVVGLAVQFLAASAMWREKRGSEKRAPLVAPQELSLSRDVRSPPPEPFSHWKSLPPSKSLKKKITTATALVVWTHKEWASGCISDHSFASPLHSHLSHSRDRVSPHFVEQGEILSVGFKPTQFIFFVRLPDRCPYFILTLFISWIFFRRRRCLFWRDHWATTR